MARRRGLTPEDMELWAAYSRTLTRLMPGRPRFPAPPELPPPPLKPLGLDASPPPFKRRGELAALGVNAAPAGVDKSTWNKFRAMKIRAQAKLDLHGHTAAKAHREVIQFVEMAHTAGLRCVEIITGNGEILARELPHWLNAPSVRPLILGLAHPHARNSGAIRLLLRRRRA